MTSRSFGAVRPALWVAIGLLLLAWVAVTAVPAAQAAPKGVVDTIGEGELEFPMGVAVNEATGDVYVVDEPGNGVLRFSEDGTFLSEIGTGGQSSAGGGFRFPNSVAVNQADGSLWVADTGNARVQRFDPLDLAGVHPFGIALGWDVIDGGGTGFEKCGPSDTCKAGSFGAGEGQFGGNIFDFTGQPAVDPVSGGVYVADPENSRVQRFDLATGDPEAAFGGNEVFSSGSPDRIAVDSTGAVYAVDEDNDRVMRCYSIGGTPEEFFCSAFASAHLSGMGVFDIAIDRDNDHVYVARRPEDGLSLPDLPIDIVELEPDGDLVEIHGRHQEVVDGIPTWVSDDIKIPWFVIHGSTGLAVNSDTGAIYLAFQPASGQPGRVLVFGDAPPVRPAAVATIDPASGVGTHSATVSGTVDPNGAPTSYQFEYRIGSAPWSTFPADAVPVGSAPGAVPETETLTGLQPDTTYQVRLAARRPFGPGDVVSAVETFTTGGVAPEVSGERATVDDTSAALEASIDANNNPTTYFFEYGLDTGYGQKTPERDGGQGANPVKRVERVTGLEPNTTYHYRAVATNAFGPTEGPDRTFTTDATGTAPDGRAYELVTPAGGVADMRINNGGIRPSTPDGNHVCIGSSFDLAGSDAGGGTQTDDAYCAHRSAAGWSIEWVAQPRGTLVVPFSPVIGAAVRWITDDGARKIYTSDFKGIVPERPPVSGDDGQEGYLRAGGQTKWATPSSPPAPGQMRHPLDASDDLTHTVYHVGTALWEWTEAGGPRQVSMVEDEDPAAPEQDTPAVGNANTGGTSQFGAGFWAVPGTMSGDGSRIFFESTAALVSADAGARDVYVRENGQTTRLLSERRGPASTTDVFFAGASEDGEVAYLRTAGQLTNDAKTNTALYRYTLDTDELELVQDRITNPLAVSADGSSVVFTGTDVLDPSDDLSLYINRDGTTTRIAPLRPGDTGSHEVGAPNHIQRAVRLTHDGSVVVFRAEATTPGILGVHRWEAGEGLATVSRTQDGTKVPGAFGNTDNHAGGVDINAGRGMTDDGETVFFETAETLDPRDVNGESDVYAWKDGKVRLVSPGAAAGSDARYLDNSADGSTVFFTTSERILSRQDTNSARDLYAARVGGGFPDLPEGTIGNPPPPAPPGGAPAPPGNTSQAPGGGDQVVDRRPTLSVAKVGAATLRAAARTGRLPVRVTLTGGGKVTVRASAVLRGKRRSVGSTSRAVRRSSRTALRLTLRLSKAARAELRRQGRLRLRISVSGSRALEPGQLSVVLRRSKGGR